MLYSLERAKRPHIAPLSKRLLSVAVLCALSQSAIAADLVINRGDHAILNGVSESYDNVVINTDTLGFWDNALISLGNHASLNISGNMVGVNVSGDAGSSTVGNTTLMGLYTSEAHIAGDIDVVSTLRGNLRTGGTNVFWIANESTLTLGQTGSALRVWAVGSKPDALSAKDRSTITINTARGQIAGSIDFVNDGSANLMTPDELRQRVQAAGFSGLRDFGTAYIGDDERALEVAQSLFAEARPGFGNVVGVGSAVHLTLDGPEAYWFGDEQNGSNAYIAANASGSSTASGWDAIVEGFAAMVAADIFKKEINKNVIQGPLDPNRGAELDLTLKNGAQWAYFGVSDSHTTNKRLTSGTTVIDTQVTVRSIPKRISAIRLEEGGIVNLFDNNVLAEWRRIGLDEVFPEVMDVKHNYVRIGKLKGSGGIFRLDLNVDDRTASDMVFIENAEGAGTFKIEPYNIDHLQAVTPTNVLRFATVSKAATDAGVKFVDKVNLYNQRLYDYELEIGHSEYKPGKDEGNEVYEKRVYDEEAATFGDAAWTEDVSNSYTSHVYTFNSDEDFREGTDWFIRRISAVEKPSVKAFGSGMEASWLYAHTLDRLHQRLGEIRYAPEKKGLWARARYERLGRHSTDVSRTMVQVGTDYLNTERNRVGLALDYNWGRADYDTLKGDADLTGFGVLFYDTWLHENGSWLDLTAYIGRQNTTLDTVEHDGAALKGKYRQRVLKLGIEGGRRYDRVTQSGVVYFLEPQLQLQYTHVGRANTRTSNDLALKIEGAQSFVGRAGLRLGREWSTDDMRHNNLYLTADVLHAFGHGQRGHVSSGDQSLLKTWGGAATWFDLGLSGQWSINQRTALHFDALKYFGAGFHNAWLLNANLRYSF
mgnify:CR=1 FL=1